MRHIIKTIAFILPVLLLTACNYMDEAPYDWVQAENVFGMENQYMKPVNQAYSYIKSGFNRIGPAFLDVATDDGACTVSNASIHKLAQGFASAESSIEGCWENSYKGIRQSLYAEEKLKEIPLVLNGMSAANVDSIKRVIRGELRALRAIYEFDLLKHYGGYPIVDRVYEVGDQEMVNMERSSFADCVQHIVSLCDTAAAWMQVQPQSNSYGRLTRGAAMAIKAKTMVYAASPLYNQPDNTNPLIGYVGATSADVEKRWQDAAAFCAAVLNLKTSAGAKVYTLYSPYDRLFITCPNNEYIVFCANAKSNGLENRQYPPSLSKNSGGGSVPTQEFVNAFTMSDGSDYTGGSASAAQYNSRDPRFASIVLYNGGTLGARGKVYTKLGEGSTKDGLNVTSDYSTNTGYYLRKFLDPTINFAVASPVTTYHLFPIIRLADIYLLLAEAMNEVYDIDADPAGLGYTARTALQAVRTRAGFNVATDKYLIGVATKDQMRDKIKRERRIELCFEEQRYFDLRRWMDGNVLNVPTHGVRIETIGGVDNYSDIVVDGRRKFETKMYFHPIPSSQIKTSPKIVQNPGW